MTAYLNGEYVYLTGFIFAMLIALWYATIVVGPAIKRRAAIRRRIDNLTRK